MQIVSEDLTKYKGPIIWKVVFMLEGIIQPFLF